MKGNLMTNPIEITITQDFVDQREERAKKYNARGRSEVQLRLDIECEVYEWFMISSGQWDDDDRWQIDGVCSTYGNVDVKFVKKWYNLTCQKLIYVLRQRDIVENFMFCEWHERPERLLIEGDVVKVNVLGTVDYWNLMDSLRTSQFNGYYVDVKKLISQQG